MTRGSEGRGEGRAGRREGRAPRDGRREARRVPEPPGAEPERACGAPWGTREAPSGSPAPTPAPCFRAAAGCGQGPRASRSGGCGRGPPGQPRARRSDPGGGGGGRRARAGPALPEEGPGSARGTGRAQGAVAPPPRAASPGARGADLPRPAGPKPSWRRAPASRQLQGGCPQGRWGRGHPGADLPRGLRPAPRAHRGSPGLTVAVGPAAVRAGPAGRARAPVKRRPAAGGRGGNRVSQARV